MLSQEIDITRVVNATAAGTTSVNGTGISLEGYQGVLFVAAFGTLTATQVTSLKAQQSSDNGSADDFSDIEGSSTAALTDSDGNKLLVLDIFQPSKLYVRPVVVRGTANAVIDGVFAIRYKSRQIPTTLGSTVKELVSLVGTTEGTA